jgi:hypothetical protein
MIGIDEFYGAFKNKFEFGVGVIVFFEHQLVHLHKVHLLIDDLDDTKTHNGGSRVDSQYNFFCCQILIGVKYKGQSKSKSDGIPSF